MDDVILVIFGLGGSGRGGGGKGAELSRGGGGGGSRGRGPDKLLKDGGLERKDWEGLTRRDDVFLLVKLGLLGPRTFPSPFDKFN